VLHISEIITSVYNFICEGLNSHLFCGQVIATKQGGIAHRFNFGNASRSFGSNGYHFIKFIWPLRFPLGLLVEFGNGFFLAPNDDIECGGAAFLLSS